jgi:hypothetical protein
MMGAGRETMYDRVVGFLSDRKGERYTPTQIGVAVGEHSSDASAKVSLALRRLVAEGAVTRADLTGTKDASGRRGRFVVYWWKGGEK